MVYCATQGPGKTQKLQVLFGDWLESEECWEKSKLVIQMRHVHTVGRRGSRKWMIKQEIVEKYKSEDIADDIIAQKMSLDESIKSTCVRQHPDSNHPDMVQFLVFDAEAEYDQSDTILDSLFSVRDGGSKDDGKKRKKKSSSSSDSSSSEESSDSKDKKKKKKKSKKSKKNKKGKKSKKKSEEQKEREKEKEREKDAKDMERKAEKEKNATRQAAKKVRAPT